MGEVSQLVYYYIIIKNNSTVAFTSFVAEDSGISAVTVTTDFPIPNINPELTVSSPPAVILDIISLVDLPSIIKPPFKLMV